MRALSCARHPDAAAEMECTPCGEVLCRACARTLRDGKTLVCARCGALLLPFRATSGPVSRAPALADTDRPLIERLPGTLLYLKSPSVLLVMLGLACFEWVAGFSLILAIVYLGTEAAVFFRIVETSAFGDDRLEAPDFTDLWESALSPLVRFLATVLPFIVIVFAAGLGFFGFLLPARSLAHELGAYHIAALVWLALWPLLIIVAAVTRSTLAVFDPRKWWNVLTEMRWDYAIAAGGFYATMLIGIFLFPWLAVRAMAIPVLGPILVYWAALLLMAWRGRILGEACRPYVQF